MRAVSLAPPPGVGLPAAEDTACKPRRAETATQSPRGVWPPGRLSLGPAARPHCPVGSRPLPPRILADNRPADKRVSSRKISGAAVTTEESRGPSAVTPLTGGHLGFGASQRRPRSHRQQGGTDGSLGVRDELPGLPVTGAILRGGKALTVSGTVASRARGAGRGGAPGVSSTHTPGVAPRSLQRRGSHSQTRPHPRTAPVAVSGTSEWAARRPNTPAHPDPRPAAAPMGPRATRSCPGRGGPRGAGRRRRAGRCWTLPTWNRTPGRHARARAGLGPAAGARGLAASARTSACQGDP